MIALLGKEYEAALSAIERAVTLNSSCATALYVGAITNAVSGFPTAAISQSNRALRLSPFDLLVYTAHLSQGIAAVQEARYDEAAACLAKSVQANPRLSSLYFIEAVALALALRVEAARPLVRRGLESNRASGSTFFPKCLPHRSRVNLSGADACLGCLNRPVRCEGALHRGR